MRLLDEIVEWAGGLRPWQQEALRLIFSKPELSAEETEAILQLVREEEQSGAPASHIARFTSDDIPGAGGSSTVRLTGVSGLEHVNGFPPGRNFALSPLGLTIFFGHNGAGKSGYARVFKNACKARHRSEVMPNAFDDDAPQRRPSADFSLLVDDEPKTVTWIQNGPADPDLSSISVYDVACASDYIDSEGTPAFQPYGLSQITRLVVLQRELQTKIEAERNALILDPSALSTLKGETEVGRYISSLGENSDDADLIRLGSFSEDDLKRQTLLKQTLLESDPIPQALVLERLAKRLEQAKKRVIGIQLWVSDRAITRAKELIENEKSTKLAMQLAQDRLHGKALRGPNGDSLTPEQTSNLIDGTGADLWQAMYRAAEAFSNQDAYPDHSFPHLEGDAHCVLCQQRFTEDAANRMRRFSAFVADSATADAQAATRARTDALAKVKTVDLTPLDETTLAEVAERLPEVNAAINAACRSWTDRHRWMCKVLEAGTWDLSSAILPAEANLDELFSSAAESLLNDANTLRESSDPEARQKLQLELAELNARQLLSNQLRVVQSFIKNSKTKAELNRCYSALNPGAVSRKLTSLAATHVTDALAASMNSELQSLGYKRRVQPDLSGRTERGITKVTLRLQEINAKASKVLSEGEQRALGMAMFLAELESLQHQSTVIFDDPSTSMDHIYRRAIAKRLIALSETRQVLIFTHDAVFLTELAMALRQIDSLATYKTISWDTAPGLVTEGLTWQLMDARERLTDLESRARALANSEDGYPTDELERKIASTYSALRGTVERAIREVFLNNTVQPFSDVVSVEAFGAVIGHPEEEWAQLQELYDRACEATEAHDTPSQRQLPPPTKDELLNDIALVSELIQRAITRRKAYQRERNQRTEKRKALF